MRRRASLGRKRRSLVRFVGTYIEPFQFSSTSSRTLTYGGNLTLGEAATVSENDLVLAYTSHRENDANIISTPAGWTKLAEVFANDNFETTVALFYKIMTATPDTAITFTYASSIFQTAGVHVFRNVNTGSPIDAAAQTFAQLNGAKPNPPAVTLTNPNAMTFAVGAASGTRVNASPESEVWVNTLTSTDLSGFRAVGEGFQTIGGGYSRRTNDPAVFGGGGNDIRSSSAAITVGIAPAA